MGGGRRPDLFVDLGSAVETPATAPSCFVGIRVDQLMPRANGEGWAQYEGQNIVIQGNCFSKQPQKISCIPEQEQALLHLWQQPNHSHSAINSDIEIAPSLTTNHKPLTTDY